MLQESLLWTVGERFRSRRKMELFFRSLMPTRPVSVLVMIHGAGQHSGQFLEFGMHCLRHNVAFYAFDLCGFGQSDGKRGHVSHFTDYLEDLDSFLEHVRRKHPDIPVFLLGHSLGGTIVIRYVQDRPNCVQGAVLSAPALKLRLAIPRSINVMCHLLSRLTPGLCLDLYECSKVLCRLGFQLNFHNDPTIRSDPLFTHQFSVRWCSELLLNAEHALRKASDFRVAVLCLCGENDPLIDPSSVKEFHDSLQIEDKKWVLIPQEKHRLLQGGRSVGVYDNITHWLLAHS